MNITLWILQGFLAVLFLVFGYMRVIKSKDELKEMGIEHTMYMLQPAPVPGS